MGKGGKKNKEEEETEEERHRVVVDQDQLRDVISAACVAQTSNPALWGIGMPRGSSNCFL
jgi:hypothetical protein